MIKSPLRYPGGKSRAIKSIVPLVPNFDEYREPFVGGGSVFVYLKQEYSSKKYWINDVYKNLVYFWKQTQQNTDKLIEKIQYLKDNSRTGKNLHKYLLENVANFDTLNKATAFFVFNRITFSGTTESGGFSNSAFNKRFTQSSIERVQALSTILSNVKITNYDYQHVVESDGNDVFIFLDPPYYSATQSALYGKNGNLHKKFNHKRFASILKNTRHKWLITYDDSKYVRDLFSFANINEWNLTYGMRNVNKNSNQNAKELFISNYELPKIEEQMFFDKILDNKLQQ